MLLKSDGKLQDATKRVSFQLQIATGIGPAGNFFDGRPILQQ
jgi:hypothetical protein